MKYYILGIFMCYFSCGVFSNELEGNYKKLIFGAGVGNSILSVKAKNQIDLYDVNEDTAVYTIFGGFNFTNWFGVEVDLSETSGFKNKKTQVDDYVVSTSLAAKFSYNYNFYTSMYLKSGLQYAAYNQEVKSPYNLRPTVWAGSAPVFGAGVEVVLDSGLTARLDYKYFSAILNKDESTSSYSAAFNGDELKIINNTFMFFIAYQF